MLDYAFPLSSFPKYFVHRTLRESRFSFVELFLHLLEQNQRVVPSFFTYMMPVPGGNSFPQNEHCRGFGISETSVIVVSFSLLRGLFLLA